MSSYECPRHPNGHGPWWDRIGHDHSGAAMDATWEPVRRLRMATTLLRTKSRRRLYHAAHMIATGEF